MFILLNILYIGMFESDFVLKEFFVYKFENYDFEIFLGFLFIF